MGQMIAKIEATLCNVLIGAMITLCSASLIGGASGTVDQATATSMFFAAAVILVVGPIVVLAASRLADVTVRRFKK
jgi:hypothetical protein